MGDVEDHRRARLESARKHREDRVTVVGSDAELDFETKPRGEALFELTECRLGYWSSFECL
jgi:hypothetical protein